MGMAIWHHCSLGPCASWTVKRGSNSPLHYTCNKPQTARGSDPFKRLFFLLSNDELMQNVV